MTNIEGLTPTTIDGVKRLAKRLKKTHGLKHGAALDAAAIQAGYRDFRDACQASPATPGFVVRITGHFSEDGNRKTMITHVRLGRGVRSFLSRYDIRYCGRFENMRIVADDHLEAHFGESIERHVSHCMGKTARALQFMDATGLKASAADFYPRRAYGPGYKVPGQDHAITWRDPETKALVLMDEPYGDIDRVYPEREAWARQNGYNIRRLEWGGTYFPRGGTVCDLVSHAETGFPIETILERMKQAGPCFREDTASWTLHDGPFSAPTPGEIAERKPRKEARIVRRRPQAAPRNGTSLTYGSGQKRPAGSLPLDRHREIGLILRDASYVVMGRPGAYAAINSLRSMLEDWADAEREGKLPNQELFALYYGDAPRSSERLKLLTLGKPSADLKRTTLTSLAKVREWLVQGYPDGVGRDRALRYIDKAVNSLESFQSRD